MTFTNRSRSLKPGQCSVVPKGHKLAKFHRRTRKIIIIIITRALGERRPPPATQTSKPVNSLVAAPIFDIF